MSGSKEKDTERDLELLEQLDQLRQRVTELEREGKPHSPYPSLLQHARDAILVIQDGVITYINHSLGTGYAVEEVTGQSLESFAGFSPSAAARIADRRQARIAGEDTPTSFETQVTAKDGAQIDVEAASATIEHEGRPAVIAVVRDITARKRVERELRESEDRFRRFSEASFEGIAIHKEGRIVEVNQTFCEMTGYGPEEVVDMPILDFAAPEHRQVVMRNVIAGRETPYEVMGLHKDGSQLPVELVGKKISYMGEPARVTAIRDITERRQAEAEREQQIQHTQKLESLGVLAGGIAHDFNNLLVGILGNASMLLADLAPDSKLRECVEEMERAGWHLAELTNQLLAYSGKGKFVTEDVDLSRIVEEMAKLLKVSTSKKVDLRYVLSRPLSMVEADPGQMRQVVMNLVTNASESTGDLGGGVSLRTGEMEVDENLMAQTLGGTEIDPGRYVFLEVADDGCGMDEETRQKIFDPFFSTKFTGRGLGLAAVVGIVRGHRGAITASSEPGRGSTFTVLLPASKRVAVEPIQPRVAPPAPRRGATILVVDDEETVRRTVQLLLEARGFRVLLARNGAEGVETFKQHEAKIDVVLLDATMPIKDGKETLEEIRALRPDVRVILSSGYNEQEVTEQFAEGELDGFIQKPYNPELLFAKIHEALVA